VLVAFNQGDIRDPYIVGSLWNGQDRPPATEPADAANKRIIRTPAGHEVLFDDASLSIHITSSCEHSIHIGREEITIEMGGGEARLRLNTDGQLTIEANETLSLRAQEITLEADRTICVSADTSVSIDGGQECTVQATQVRIN
jgi:uncharacterized protein involved in type VI secretion and phage assembly